jgi:O-antigen ligase
MKRKVMGVVIIICAIGLIAIAKISPVPAFVTVLLVVIAVGLVLFALTWGFTAPSSSSKNKDAS